jgi:hypothetical protein
VGGIAYRHLWRVFGNPSAAPVASAPETAHGWCTPMTTATCKPSLTPVSLQDRERRPDRLGDLLECLADLLIEVGQQRAAVAELADGAGAAGRDALERLSWLERAIKGIGVEASNIHQLLQHEQLI